MMSAVEKVYKDYRERIGQQHREMERTLSVSVALPQPRGHLRFSAAGLEVIIRYPVEVENAAEVDVRVTREMLRALEQSPRLRLVGSGAPVVQPVSEEKPVSGEKVA